MVPKIWDVVLVGRIYTLENVILGVLNKGTDKLDKLKLEIWENSITIDLDNIDINVKNKWKINLSENKIEVNLGEKKVEVTDNGIMLKGNVTIDWNLTVNWTTDLLQHTNITWGLQVDGETPLYD
jgi:hypothetical protein